MSLDPTLIMNNNRPAQPDYASAMMKGYQIQNAAMQPALTQAQTQQTQQQTANLAAQQPGIQAQSGLQARSLAAKQWFGLHLPDMMTTDPTTGKQTLDMPKAMAMANSSGFADLVPEMASEYAAGTQAQIKSATDQQTLNQIKFKASVDAPGVIAQYVQAAPPGQKVAAYQAARAAALQQFGPQVINDNNVPLDPTNLDGWVQSAKAATLTPETQKTLAISQQNANTSQHSVNIQGQQQNMTAQDHGVAAINAVNEAGILENGSIHVSDWANTKLPTGAGNWSNTQWQTYIQANPNMQATYQAIIKHNALTGDDLKMTSPPDAIRNALHADAIRMNSLAGAYSATAKAGGAPTPPVVPATPQAINGAAPQPMTPQQEWVQVQTPKGDVMMPPAEAAAIQRYKAAHGIK